MVFFVELWVWKIIGGCGLWKIVLLEELSEYVDIDIVILGLF